MHVLWPSFLTAIAAEFLIFAIFDPLELVHALQPVGLVLANMLDLSRTGFYSIVFFAIWLFGACTSALSLWLASGTASRDPAAVLWPGEPDSRR